MTTHSIDNSDAGYIERVILWQYDNAEHLKGIILGLKNFYDQSTKKHFDEMVGRMNIDDEDIDNYGLAVWGKILNTNRPNLTYVDEETNEEVTRPLSKGVYRKILLGKIKLFEGSATLKEFAEYIKSIFGNGVICTDGLDMSLRFDRAANVSLDPELDALITQAPDVVFVYPAGARSSEYSNSPIIGFAEQVRINVNGSVVGLLVHSKPQISIANTTSEEIVLPTGFWFVHDNVKYTAGTEITLSPGEIGEKTLESDVDGSIVNIGEKVLLRTNDPDTDGILYGVVITSGIRQREITGSTEFVATPPDFNLETLSNGSIAWKR